MVDRRGLTVPPTLPAAHALRANAGSSSGSNRTGCTSLPGTPPHASCPHPHLPCSGACDAQNSQQYGSGDVLDSAQRHDACSHAISFIGRRSFALGMPARAIRLRVVAPACFAAVSRDVRVRASACRISAFSRHRTSPRFRRDDTTHGENETGKRPRPYRGRQPLSGHGGRRSTPFPLACTLARRVTWRSTRLSRARESRDGSGLRIAPRARGPAVPC